MSKKLKHVLSASEFSYKNVQHDLIVFEVAAVWQLQKQYEALPLIFPFIPVFDIVFKPWYAHNLENIKMSDWKQFLYLRIF